MNVGQSLLQGSPPRTMNVPTYTPSPSSNGPHIERSAPDASETIIDLEDEPPLLSISLASPQQLPPSSAHTSPCQNEEKKDNGYLTQQNMWRRSLGLGDSGVIQGRLLKESQEGSTEPRSWPYLKDGRQASKDSGKTLTEAPEEFQKTAMTPTATGHNSSGSYNPYKLTLDIDIDPPQHSVYGMPGTRKTDSKDLIGRSASPFLLHTLSPSSTPTTPPPPTPSTPSGISPSGKRYVDPRKRNKGRKDAFKTGKVLFSNERTFIHWIKFGMLLGALAMTLLNFSGEGAQRTVVDQELAQRAGKIGQLVGVALIVICMLCLAYATFIFHWRHLGVVRNQSDDRYFDRVGPTALTLALFVAYALNVYLTLQVTSKMDPNYQPISLYNNRHTANTPGYHPPLPMPTPAVFDTPRLPPGSTILVDDEDEEEDRETDGLSSPAIESTTTDHPTTASLPGADGPSIQSTSGSATANAVAQSQNGPTTESYNDDEEEEEEEDE